MTVVTGGGARIEFPNDAAPCSSRSIRCEAVSRLADLRGDVEDGQTLLGLTEEQGEDLPLGSDVDAAGWLVEQNHLGVGQQASCRSRPSAGCRPTAR